MKAVCSSETSVSTYNLTRRDNPEEQHRHLNSENLKCDVCNLCNFSKAWANILQPYDTTDKPFVLLFIIILFIYFWKLDRTVSTFKLIISFCGFTGVNLIISFVFVIFVGRYIWDLKTIYLFIYSWHAYIFSFMCI
jgi:hypothetical protein